MCIKTKRLCAKECVTSMLVLGVKRREIDLAVLGLNYWVTKDHGKRGLSLVGYTAYSILEVNNSTLYKATHRNVSQRALMILDEISTNVFDLKANS